MGRGGAESESSTGDLRGVVGRVADRFSNLLNRDPGSAGDIMKRTGLVAVGSLIFLGPLAVPVTFGYATLKCVQAWKRSAAKNDPEAVNRNRPGRKKNPRRVTAKAFAVGAAVTGSAALFGAPLVAAAAAGSSALIAGRALNAWKRAGDDTTGDASPAAPHPPRPDSEKEEHGSTNSVFSADSTEAKRAWEMIERLNVSAEDARTLAEVGAINIPPRTAELMAAVANKNRDYFASDVEGDPYMTGDAEVSGDETSEEAKAPHKDFTGQCRGRTKKGARCSRQAIGDTHYCHQHAAENSAEATAPTSGDEVGGPENYVDTTDMCRGRTQSGDRCRKKSISGGKFCAEHAPERPAAQPYMIDDGTGKDRFAPDPVALAVVTQAVVDDGITSPAELQRKTGNSMTEIGAYLNFMEEQGIIGPLDASGNRVVHAPPGSGEELRKQIITGLSKPDPGVDASHSTPLVSLLPEETAPPENWIVPDRPPKTKAQKEADQIFRSLEPATEVQRQALREAAAAGDSKQISELLGTAYFPSQERGQAVFDCASTQLQDPGAIDKTRERITETLESLGLSGQAAGIRSLDPGDVSNASRRHLRKMIENQGDKGVDHWKVQGNNDLTKDVRTTSVTRTLRDSISQSFNPDEIENLIGRENIAELVTIAEGKGLEPGETFRYISYHLASAVCTTESGAVAKAVKEGGLDMAREAIFKKVAQGLKKAKKA